VQKRADLERAKQKRATLLQLAMVARRKALGVCQEKKEEEDFRLEIMELELEREEEEAEKDDTESTDNDEDADPVQKVGFVSVCSKVSIDALFCFVYFQAITKMTTNRARALNLKLEGLDDETIDEVCLNSSSYFSSPSYFFFFFLAFISSHLARSFAR
jgi:arginine decarboxylase-like protein